MRYHGGMLYGSRYPQLAVLTKDNTATDSPADLYVVTIYEGEYQAAGLDIEAAFTLRCALNVTAPQHPTHPQIPVKPSDISDHLARALQFLNNSTERGIDARNYELWAALVSYSKENPDRWNEQFKQVMYWPINGEINCHHVSYGGYFILADLLADFKVFDQLTAFAQGECLRRVLASLAVIGLNAPEPRTFYRGDYRFVTMPRGGSGMLSKKPSGAAGGVWLDIPADDWNTLLVMAGMVCMAATQVSRILQDRADSAASAVPAPDPVPVATEPETVGDDAPELAVDAPDQADRPWRLPVMPATTHKPGKVWKDQGEPQRWPDLYHLTCPTGLARDAKVFDPDGKELPGIYGAVYELTPGRPGMLTIKVMATACVTGQGQVEETEKFCGCEFNNVPCSTFSERGDTGYCLVCGHPEICHRTDQGYAGQEPKAPEPSVDGVPVSGESLKVAGRRCKTCPRIMKETWPHSQCSICRPLPAVANNHNASHIG